MHSTFRSWRMGHGMTKVPTNISRAGHHTTPLPPVGLPQFRSKVFPSTWHPLSTSVATCTIVHVSKLWTKHGHHASDQESLVDFTVCLQPACEQKHQRKERKIWKQKARVKHGIMAAYAKYWPYLNPRIPSQDCLEKILKPGIGKNASQLPALGVDGTVGFQLVL